MPRNVYNKLVRDRIPTIIRQSGRQLEFTVLSEEDYRQALRDKLTEEAKEAAEAVPSELSKEIGDVLEVLDALRMAYGMDWREIENLRQKRREERGGFENRVFLLWTE